MPRWEFHLSPDDMSTASRWVWMSRDGDGESVTSATTFRSYGECICDALLHGYQATEYAHDRHFAFAGAPGSGHAP